MITSKQLLYIDLILNNRGKAKTKGQIAKQLGVSRQTLNTWEKNKDFIKYYDNVVMSRIREMSADALQTYKDLLQCEDPRVRHAVAKDILDRAGYTVREDISMTFEPITIINNIKE